ncbi:putative membrane protein [Nocardioides ginsengisegetis]|uniref:Putative membrane protein n=1 Tax=Nocardioides ginsengisegetis TaxID=661491 RepID=A0A7W3P825_9ACTN|nr:DUF2157 domain-containing protein [Nocardioides ginsengisegetis]MBA8801956.1 putative membrane protein [Nocardioides ginsengisegetis]
MTTDAPARGQVPVSPGQLEWLTHEIGTWQGEGLLTEAQAAAITGRYRASRRFSVGRLLLTLGAMFVGVGLIWLVAANLDTLSPLGRFVAVAAIWLAVLVTGEVLARRRAGHPAIPAAVVGAVRLLAALAFGAVVLQAADSLDATTQTGLAGYWALGALVHAYAVRATMPLLVGIATGSFWFVTRMGDDPSGLAAVLCLTGSAVLAVSLAVVHQRWLRGFVAPWREAGALLALVGLFVAALPFVDAARFAWTPALGMVVAAAGAAAVAALVLASGTDRFEPLGALAVSAVAVVLVLWDAGSDTDAPLTTGAVLHAVLSVVVYVLTAVAVAVLGTLRDSWRLTGLATAALVVFTTFQSFAVFARVVTGAWLFLLLGLVFLATGVLFDRARREIAANLEDAD